MRKKEVENSVLELSRARVAEVFDRYDFPSVSFSAGKDSTVIFNLALEEAQARREDGRLPPDYRLDVFFWDEEAVHPETIEYAERVASLPDVSFRWFCLPILHVNACSKVQPYWYPWAPEDRALWVRDLPERAITDPDFPRAGHHESMPYVFREQIEAGLTVGLMTGIRADESMRRFMSVTSRVEDNWMSPIANARTIQHCKPIYDWSTIDVWTAPALLGWDWNRAYDVMTRAGIPPSVQRVAPPFGQQPLQNLWMWQVCWPDLWEKMIHRVDGAATAARYCRSPLYGTAGGAKADDETWEEAILREISRWAPEVQSKIATRIRREIGRHAKMHPGKPVPDYEPVVDLVRGISSGLTNEFLLRVAIKGDFKNRMSLGYLDWKLLDELRTREWGATWRERFPSIAERNVWSGSEWVSPAEAARRSR